MNITGLLISYILLFIMFIIAIIFPIFPLRNETIRKLVHIGMSNWWIIALLFFDNYFYALIPPFTFIILNYLSYRFNLIKSIERKDKSDLGTIYYPLSFFILILFSYTYLHLPYIGALGGLIMGYGDGIATIIGIRYGKKKLYKKKSIIGSISMFIISYIIVFIILFLYNPIHIVLFSFIIALLATIFELFSSRGIDNLTVPLLSALVYYCLLLI